MSKGADIASATTTDIGASAGHYLEVTGTATITGLGTVQAGTRRIVGFTGALILTHNATSLILPTAANITTAKGDRATFKSLGFGNWICTDYNREDGTSEVAESIAERRLARRRPWLPPGRGSSLPKVHQRWYRSAGGAPDYPRPPKPTPESLKGKNEIERELIEAAYNMSQWGGVSWKHLEKFSKGHADHREKYERAIASAFHAGLPLGCRRCLRG